MKFQLNSDRIDELNSNYTLFHPTIDQMQILYYMAKQLSNILDCDEVTCRNLLIQSYVSVQQQQKLFHYTIDSQLPQIRLKYAENVYLEIEQILLTVLKEENQQELLKTELKKLFDEYFSKFATR